MLEIVKVLHSHLKSFLEVHICTFNHEYGVLSRSRSWVLDIGSINGPYSWILNEFNLLIKNHFQISALLPCPQFLFYLFYFYFSLNLSTAHILFDLLWSEPSFYIPDKFNDLGFKIWLWIQKLLEKHDQWN